MHSVVPLQYRMREALEMESIKLWYRILGQIMFVDILTIGTCTKYMFDMVKEQL